MKIIVFGATGSTGREIVRQAVEEGHSVTAFTRSADASLEENSEVRVVHGDVFDGALVADAIAGHRAGLSALGPRTLKKTRLLESAIPNILSGMRQHYISRLIVLGAAGVEPGYGKYQNALTRIGFWLMMHTALRNPFADQAAQERLLAASSADYTIVRRCASPMVRGPASTVWFPTVFRREACTSRADVASFMLLQLTDPRFHRQGPYIAG